MNSDESSKLVKLYSGLIMTQVLHNAKVALTEKGLKWSEHIQVDTPHLRFLLSEIERLEARLKKFKNIAKDFEEIDFTIGAKVDLTFIAILQNQAREYLAERKDEE